MLEREIEKKVVEHCRRRGLHCRKLTSPSNRGMPDRLICGRGKVMFLELKAEGERPTALQLREGNLLADAGMFCTWADRVQLAVEIIDDFFTDDQVG